MTGVDIVGALLRENEELVTIVPLARIKATRLPDDALVPAILVRQISGVERVTLKRGSVIRVTDRVSVTVRAENYDQQRELIRMARNICAGQTGSIAGAANVAVISAGTGPDLLGPADTFEQSTDFRVGYDDPTA